MKTAGKNIIIEIIGVAGHGCGFILYYIIPQNKFEIMIDVINVPNPQCAEFNIRRSKISTQLTDLCATGIGIGIIPIIFDANLVTLIDNIL